MKSTLLASALALLVAGPAAANDQLARSLGLEPGVFTTSELARIAGLLASGDSTDRRIAEDIVAGAGTVAFPDAGTPSAGHEQLAANLGLDADSYGLQELATIAGLRASGDFEDVRVAEEISARAEASGLSTMSGPSAGRLQLAANLGLDPNAFSTAELVRIAGLLESGDSTDRRIAEDLMRR